jgi:energy-coupling factor transport system permease protein
MALSQMLFYRRVASPLHAARASVGAMWALALTAATLVLFHPLALLALLGALAGAIVAAGVGHALSRVLRLGLLVALPIVLINVLVSREGLTVFARLGDLGPFGQGDLTVEALVYGAVVGLKVMLLIAIATLASLAIDPDELLRIFHRLSFRSALTASLATRMIPLLAADALRLAEAQRTRPRSGAHPARERVALLGAIVGGALDRALDVAATLEVRGFAASSGRRERHRTERRLRRPGGQPPRRPRGRHRRPWSRHDLTFAASAVAVLALAVGSRFLAGTSFSAYPLVRMPIDAGVLALCAALGAAVLLPLCDRRGIA